MRAVFLLFMVALLSVCGACDNDQDDPYDDQNPLDLDLPSLDPNRYHYDGFTDPYYEQWQFRVTGPAGRAFIFIYGVQNPNAYAPNVGTAYVQALDGEGNYLPALFPTADFKGSIKECRIRIGDNTASTERLTGHLISDSNEVSWELDLAVDEPWTATMGGLTNIPYLPVNWYVGILRGRATGKIVWNGATIRLTDAPVFQDHHWGYVFPEAYVWFQAQKNDDPDWSLALAGARSDAESQGTGGLFVWRRGEELWEWRTLDAKTRLSVVSNPAAREIRVELTRERQRVVLLGQCGDVEPLDFLAPQADGLTPYGWAAPAGRLKIELYEKVNLQWTQVEEEWIENAAVLFGGEFLTAE